MIGKIKRKRVNIFILEIICTLGIFMIISVFLVKLFVGANSLEQKARDTTKACLVAENIAETIKGYRTMEQAIKQLKLQQIQDNQATAIYEKYYDSEWNPIIKRGKYRVILTVEQQRVSKHMYYDINIIVKNEKKYPIIKNGEGHELVSLQISAYK